MLKERSAGLDVDIAFVSLADLYHPVLLALVLGVLDGLGEELLVPLETELVHWVDLAQLVQYKEQSCSHLSAWLECRSGVVDSLHGKFRLVQNDLDFVGSFLGLRERCTQVEIFKKVHL